MTQLVDLSHDITPGMFTHPGLPGPERQDHRSREEYERSTGTTFQIDRVCMVGNTGTYLDSPYHRFADKPDLAGLPLSTVANLRLVIVDARRVRAVGPDDLHACLGEQDLSGGAVLLRTGGDEHWGSERYAVDAPYLTAAGAEWLARKRPALVGIDSVNIDDLDDVSRPAHTRLLGNGILILEHLTGLAALPATGGRLHAAPLAWHGVGTWPVRAYALVENDAAVGTGTGA